MSMYLAKIMVTLRPSILDPQGKAVHHALESLGMGDAREVRMGKYIEMKIEGRSQEEAGKVLGLNPGEVITVSRMASRMLSLGFHLRIECEEGDSARDRRRIQNAANYWLPRDF